MDNIIKSFNEDTTRNVVLGMTKKNGLIRHQIESFEKFVEILIPNMIHENSTTTIDSEITNRRHVIEFKEVTIMKPTFKESNGINRVIYPYESRLRGLTYNISVLANIQHTIYDISIQKENPPLCEEEQNIGVLICQIPVMVKSKFCRLYKNPYFVNECPYDQGGFKILSCL